MTFPGANKKRPVSSAWQTIF